MGKEGNSIVYLRLFVHQLLQGNVHRAGSNISWLSKLYGRRDSVENLPEKCLESVYNLEKQSESGVRSSVLTIGIQFLALRQHFGSKVEDTS